MILNASALNGSSSEALRTDSRSSPPLTGSTPVTGGTSSGLGRKSMTASSSGCTPLFLKDEPHRTGVIWLESVAARIAATRRSLGISCSSRIISSSSRSEEHTSELQSRQYLVCRLLLEKK